MAAIIGGSFAALLLVAGLAGAYFLHNRRRRSSGQYYGPARLLHGQADNEGYVMEKDPSSSLANRRSAAGGGVLGLGGLWQSSPGKTRRADMLADEESIWDGSHSRRPSDWATFDDEAVVGAGAAKGMVGWESVRGEPEEERALARGSGYRDHALGDWIASPTSRHTLFDAESAYEDSPRTLSNPYDPPLAGDDFASSEESSRPRSGTSESIRPTSSSEFNSNTAETSASPSKLAFSPSSLYGSNFATQPVALLAGLRRSGTWWNRFTSNKDEHELRPGAREAIRDPTRAPDPFADPVHSDDASISSNEQQDISAKARGKYGALKRLSAVDELGRGSREGSQSSSLNSATSSLLEERFRNMEVVQRLRQASGSTEDHFSTSELGVSAHTTPMVGDQTPGSIIWDGPANDQLIMSPTDSLAGAAQLPEVPLHLRPTSSGVLRMAREYERRNSEMEPSATPVIASPRQSRGKTDAIEHGLVRKPQLFVANPDG